MFLEGESPTLNLFLQFKFSELDIFLKNKPDSGSICKYESLKLWRSCEIYLTVHDGNDKLRFNDSISSEKK